jgi:flagellar motor switch protein FliN/FliY
MSLSREQIVRALVEQLAAGWGRRLGGVPAVEPDAPARRAGWAVSLRSESAGAGHLIVWFDEVVAAAWTRRALALDADAGDDQTSALVGELVEEAVRTLETQPDFAGLSWAEPQVTAAQQPDHAAVVAFVDGEQGRLSAALVVDVEAAKPAAPAPPADHRLQTVLDVDLPLVVRFGRAIMPLRSVADLGPGAVIDMGRSPDEPVELLVGDRLVARGEVVVVGGNYGVRITELADGQQTVHLEAHAS